MKNQQRIGTSSNSQQIQQVNLKHGISDDQSQSSSHSLQLSSLQKQKFIHENNSNSKSVKQQEGGGILSKSTSNQGQQQQSSAGKNQNISEPKKVHWPNSPSNQTSDFSAQDEFENDSDDNNGLTIKSSRVLLKHIERQTKNTKCSDSSFEKEENKKMPEQLNAEVKTKTSKQVPTEQPEPIVLKKKKTLQNKKSSPIKKAEKAEKVKKEIKISSESELEVVENNVIVEVVKNSSESKKQKNQKLQGVQALESKNFYKSMGMALSHMNLNIQSDADNKIVKEERRSKRKSQEYKQESHKKKKFDQNDMRKILIENYGVELAFGGFYYSDSKFVPNHEEYILTSCWHIVPQGNTKIVQTTKINGEYEEEPYEKIYDQSGSDCLLQLMKPLKDQGKFETIRQIQLKGVRECIIQFSNRGTLLGIYSLRQNLLQIYDSRDINLCMHYISINKYLFKFKINDESLKIDKPSRIIFDLRDRYVGVASKTQIQFYSTYEENKIQEIVKYQISENSEQILDILIDSKGIDSERPFKCMIACKLDSGRKQIQVFDIFDDLNISQNIRSILYKEEAPTESLVVKISNDFNQIVFSNGIEHYILHGRSQDFYSQIGEKTIRKCLFHDDIFYFVSSNSRYDRDVVVQHSQDRKYKIKIKRCLEPGQIKIFDCEIQYDAENENSLNMRIIMNQGDYLYLDHLKINTGQKMCQSTCLHVSQVDKFYMAYGFNWPYFSYATKFNNVFILNAFNPDFIQRYQLPENVSRIMKTFLTDSHDVFIHCETFDGNNEVYNIDLDSETPYIEGPLFIYSYSDVNNQPITDFHVRASSRKEKINLNKACIAFMMHGDELYGWCQNDSNNILPVNSFSDDPNPKAKCSNYYYLSDDIIFYMTTVDKKMENSTGSYVIKSSQIKMVETQFGNYKVTQIYTDPDERAEILNFGVDNTCNRLMILSRVQNTKGKSFKFFTLYELDTDKVIINVPITSKEIIGRLKSNLYNLVGGHIYFNNTVIKIRYDCIEGKGGDIYENQLFDPYQDILLLETDDQIQSGTPMQTCLYNRLAYVIQNQKQQKARRVLIMPYLHERKIIINRRHKTNQFYTLIKHQNGINYIVCLCIEENKMYVYTEQGILVDRVSYQDLADLYGKPISISENGLILIFRKSQESSQIHLIFIHINRLQWVETIDIKEKIDGYFAKFEQKLKDDDASGHQKLNFYNKFLKNIDKMSDLHLKFWLNDDAEVFIKISPAKKQKLYKGSSSDDESGSDNEQFQDAEINEAGAVHQIYFFNPNPKITIMKQQCNCCFGCSILGQEVDCDQSDENEHEEEEENEEFIFFDQADDLIYDCKGVAMNRDYIFFWNNGKIWKLHASTQVLSEIKLYVDERQIETFVKTVRTGSDRMKVAIRVQQTQTMDCIVIWDLKKDVEAMSFDVSSDAIFFQDSSGNFYLIENDYIINCSQTCKLKAYDFRVSDFQVPNFDFGSGYRVDEEFHNFVLMRNQLNLSFSYMTFIIKMNFDKGGYLQQDYLFDVEGYNYILNRNNVLTEGQLVISDYDKLQFILINFEKLDPILLEQLYYKNFKNKTPLHLAVAANNTRNVNLILEFMSKIKNSGLVVIKDIFKDLIDFSNFALYLNNSPSQSVQMINKQTLVIPDFDNEEIIKVCPSRSSYVDEDYFEEVMGEDMNNPNNQTFGVNIKSIRADWILNDEEGIGMEFLQAMLHKRNRDVFMTPYMKIIIQFLYAAYSYKIKLILLPPYLAHLFAVNLQILGNEYMRRHREILKEFEFKNDIRPSSNNEFTSNPEIMAIQLDLQKSIIQSNIIVLICGAINILNMFVFFMQTKYLGKEAFFRIWSIVDFAIILTNIVTLINVFYKFGTQYIRLVEVVLILCMWFKSLYYMRLISKIAPLIESIFVIMNDMIYFLLIFFIGIFAFAEAFFIVGKNQVMLGSDEKHTGTEHYEVQIPSYFTFQGSFFHIYMSALGNLDISEYQDNDMTGVLLILFVFLSFFMCIHLLNMLIAIMGDSFAKNAEISESNRNISQLEFVINNWWIHPIKNKHEIVYIVSAFAHGEDDAKEGVLEELNFNIKDLNKTLLNIMIEVKKISKQNR